MSAREEQLDFFGQPSPEGDRHLSTGERVAAERVEACQRLIAEGVGVHRIARRLAMGVNTVCAIRDGMSPEVVDTQKRRVMQGLIDIATVAQEVIGQKLADGSASLKDATIAMGVALQRHHELSGAANVHHHVHHEAAGPEDAVAWLEARLAQAQPMESDGEVAVRKKGGDLALERSNVDAGDSSSPVVEAVIADSEAVTAHSDGISSDFEPVKRDPRGGG